MITVIKKIFALIMSFFMMIFGIFSDKEPVDFQKIEVINNNYGINTNGEYLFETYEEYVLYLTTVNRSNEMKAYSEKIGRDFFVDNNLAVIDVTLADSGEKAVVVSVQENGCILEVNYSVEASSDIAATVICYDSICIKTGKQITAINSAEL